MNEGGAAAGGEAKHQKTASRARVETPTPVVKILGWENRKRNGEVHTYYELEVVNGPLKWTVFKRYSEFVELHKQIQKLGPSLTLPKMPPGTIFGRLKEDFITKRLELLVVYWRELCVLLGKTHLDLSVPFLSFIGALSNEAQASADRIPHLQVRKLRVDRVLELAQEGDLFLFKTAGFLQSLHRGFVNSAYDHVGIVVRDPAARKDDPDALELMEATMEGVCRYVLRRRLRAWHVSKAQMAYKQLNVARTPGRLAALQRFVEEEDGKPYSLTPAKLLRKVSAVSPHTAADHAQLQLLLHGTGAAGPRPGIAGPGAGAGTGAGAAAGTGPSAAASGSGSGSGSAPGSRSNSKSGAGASPPGSRSNSTGGGTAIDPAAAAPAPAPASSASSSSAAASASSSSTSSASESSTSSSSASPAAGFEPLVEHTAPPSAAAAPSSSSSSSSSSSPSSSAASSEVLAAGAGGAGAAVVPLAYETRQGWFCSELVASAYKQMGLLPEEKSASAYLPVAFSDAHDLRLLDGATFQKEILVDWSVPECSTAKFNSDSSAAAADDLSGGGNGEDAAAPAPAPAASDRKQQGQGRGGGGGEEDEDDEGMPRDSAASALEALDSALNRARGNTGPSASASAAGGGSGSGSDRSRSRGPSAPSGARSLAPTPAPAHSRAVSRALTAQEEVLAAEEAAMAAYAAAACAASPADVPPPSASVKAVSASPYAPAPASLLSASSSSSSASSGSSTSASASASASSATAAGSQRLLDVFAVPDEGRVLSPEAAAADTAKPRADSRSGCVRDFNPAGSSSRSGSDASSNGSDAHLPLEQHEQQQQGSENRKCRQQAAPPSTSTTSTSTAASASSSASECKSEAEAETEACGAEVEAEAEAEAELALLDAFPLAG